MVCDEEGAQIVDAVDVVGVLVAQQHAVEPVHTGIEQLFAQVGRGVHQDAGAAAIGCGTLDQDGAAPAAIFWIFRIASAPSGTGPRHAAGEAAAQNGDRIAHAAAAESRGTLLNNRKKFSVVCTATASYEMPRVAAKAFAVSVT